MREKKSYRKLLLRASALAMSAFMMTAAAPPVWADGTQENSVVSESAGSTDDKTGVKAGSNDKKGEYTIIFQDVSGNVLETFNASKGETWGPSGDISVRSTFYKNGKDYDIVSGPNERSLNAESPCMQVDAEPSTIKDNMVFTYREHQENAYSAASHKTYKCMTEDGTLLYMFTGSEDKIPETLAPGSKLYTRSSKKNDSKDTAVENVYYTLTKDTDTRYPVTVNYVNADDGSTITSRIFYIK